MKHAYISPMKQYNIAVKFGCFFNEIHLPYDFCKCF